MYVLTSKIYANAVQWIMGAMLIWQRMDQAYMNSVSITHRLCWCLMHKLRELCWREKRITWFHWGPLKQTNTWLTSAQINWVQTHRLKELLRKGVGLFIAAQGDDQHAMTLVKKNYTSNLQCTHVVQSCF